MNRIAVLPFQNQGDASYDYLADGLTELALHTLRTFPDYLVIAKESIDQLTKQECDGVEAIFQKIPIDILLIGKLTIEEKLCLQLTAFDKNQQHPLWEETLTAELRHVVSFGNQLVDFFKNKMNTATTQKHAIVNKLPQNRQAYRAYLLGEHYLHKWNRAYTELALTQFEKVVELEPDFIQGYLGITKATVFLVGRGYKSAEKFYPKILASLDQMLLLNPNYGELYIYKGIIQFFYLLNWDKAYRNIEKGLKNYSEASEAYSQLSMFWYGMKQYDKAIDAIHAAMEYNPLSVSLLHMKGDVLVSAERYEEATKTFQSILELQPNDLPTIENLMYIAALQGKERLTKKYLRLMQKDGELSVVSYPRIGFVYGRLGMETEANQVIRELEQQVAEDKNATHYNRLASVYAGLRDWERTMFYIEKSFPLRAGILFILTDPLFKPLRKWKRFSNLVKEIQLPENILEEDVLTIKSDLKKTIQVHPTRLLYAESDQNYTTLVQYNNFRLEKTLLRASIKKVLEQLPKAQFFQCHRSYFVNKNLAFDITGNARGYRMRSIKYDFEVPVSRSKIGEMKAVFE